jgi:peptide/nickel transport system substrate-binding protein
MGGGTYFFVEVDEGDGTVYFERNENFDTMGGDNVYNANIKYVALKIVESGAEYNALDAGDVHYATVSATADVMSDIADQSALVAILVDNLGYGYICINPQVYPNINFRIALSSVFDKTQVLEYYPNGLADIIHRSQSQVSWAYPEGAEPVYPYDEDLSTAIEYFQAAGFTWNGTAFTDVPAITFTLPSAADAHPAGGIYLKAQTLLATIGITANIVTDVNLIANIKKAPVGVYALAWQSSQDPDMYQVNHYASQADSVIANGIAWLYENGDAAKGTIDVVKMDETTVEMTQTEALKYLGDLIEEAVTYMLPEERAPIYAKALEVLAQLVIEVPTYQRKNLFVYDGTIVDANSLSTSVTPYWGPMSEIWKVRFVEGTVGNEIVEP